MLFSKPHRAFSLLELLAAIAIIAILASIIIPIGFRSIATTEKTRCAANLRQIGQTLQLYLNDHSLQFPGPLYSDMSAWAPRGSHMPTVLEDYMTPSETIGSRRYFDIFFCPACVRRAADTRSMAEIKSYSTGRNPRIFGYQHSRYPQAVMRLTDIESPPTTVVLQDASGASNGITSTAHETFRNVLYVDWHVESVPEEEFSN
ncbi:MAG: prepilin-type N-terminal cleavage/methylation domain-containing protein [Puniceicoccales bacterium]